MNFKIRVNKIYLTFTIIILFASCENLNEIGELNTEYSVFINLAVNEDKQEFYLYNTLPIDSAINGYPFGSNDEFFVDSPYLSFTDVEGNVFDNFKLEQRPEGYINRKYITNLTEFEVQPNSEYRIFIQMDRVSIESSVKSLPKFKEFNVELGLEESNGEEIIIPLTLRWDNIAQCKYYIMERKYYRRYQHNDSTLFSSTSTRTDFILAAQGNYLKTFNITSILESQYILDSLYIKLTAYDNNSYKHFYEKNDQVNITNAYGYIGSSSIADTMIVLK